jgi:hypothetical protein
MEGSKIRSKQPIEQKVLSHSDSHASYAHLLEISLRIVVELRDEDKLV